MRLAALLVLLAQLALPALPHTERLPDDRASLQAAQTATVSHGHVCQACLLAHAPAAPAVPVALAIVPGDTPLLAPPTQLVALCTSSVTIRSRAPPACPA